MQSISNGAGALCWRERMAVRHLNRLQLGVLRLTLSGGESIVFAGKDAGPQATLVMRSPRAVSRLWWAGESGFAEGYMHGDWDSPDLPALLQLLHCNGDALAPDSSVAQRLHARMVAMRHRLRRNSRRGSRSNVAYHYDLGNEFYRHWLDETWSYSGAIFANPDEDLASAQRRKYQRLLERIRPAPGDHVLEIGCGWGGFALYAAQATGCRVTGITLSREQLRFAREQAEAAGLTGRVRFDLRDYRDVGERYDHVVSIEMYEAVGEAYWPTYFAKIRESLRPGGRAAIQAITIDDAHFADYRGSPDFIQQYIFPGGMLASPRAFEHAARAQGMRPMDSEFHGPDYERTLRRWDAAVLAARRRIVASHGERFFRMWRYYLAYCVAGFASGNIDLMHITLARD
ncbi:MAG: cyclopropane-fatty-acyl-phospholipid synthase family protein, partial [Salinisphaera sp.]|nr:cyclopropane-fatty-acyl-phospholipid synthase family protein [Salinisphaera sp.]